MRTEITDTNQARNSERLVAVELRGGRVTAGFRAALFAASDRAGLTPNEFALRAAAEKLKAEGAPFEGVFAAGDMISRPAASNLLEGDQSRTALDIGGGWVTVSEKAAFDLVRPKGTYFNWAVDLMRAAVRAKAAA